MIGISSALRCRAFYLPIDLGNFLHCLGQPSQGLMTLCCLQDDIVFKGVVFNEMKGVYSQPDSMNNTITQQVSPSINLVGTLAHY